MGFAVSFSLEPVRRQMRFRLAALLVTATLALASCLLSPGLDGSVARAQPSSSETPAAKAPDKLVIDADELIYDKDKNTVSAAGSVQLFYQGRVLQADRVVYDRVTKRVYAEGHAKMTDEHGDVVYGSRFELSDNFREGFIDSVQVLTSDKTRFTSPRAERSGGDVTVLQRGAYTACEPCKDHPEWPPFWQVRAARIIENQETHTVYFEDAQILVWGVPVFYMPYFSSPDATVNKQTGLLAPQIVSGANLGYGVSFPYFINLAPNYDLTVIPTYLSKQGLLGEVDWRQRLSNGVYSIRDDGNRPAGAQPFFRRTPTAPATTGCAARSRPRATSFSTSTGSSAGTPPGCPTNFSPTITNCRVSTSATTISRTSSRRSTCADRPTTASSTSAAIISRARRRTIKIARCRSRRRSSTTTESSPSPLIVPMGLAAKRRSIST